MTTENKSAFARRLGVSPSYITKLGEEGRLVLEGRLVNVEASLASIDATKDPNRDDVRQRHSKARDVRRMAEAVNRSAIAPDAVGDGGAAGTAGKQGSDPAGGGGGQNNGVGGVQAAEVFRKARTAKMHYEARRAVIRVARRQDRLTDMSLVRAAGWNDGAILRAMLENLSDRAAPILAPVRDAGVAEGVFGKILDEIGAEWEGMLVKHVNEIRSSSGR